MVVERAVWRVARTVLAVWTLASAVFLLSHRDAETAVRLALPDAGDLSRRGGLDSAREAGARASVRRRLGLDLPLFYAGRYAHGWVWHGTRNQYHRWAWQTIRGDLGTSFRTSEPVTHRLRAALGVTLPLTGTAATLAVALALALAQALAARPRWHGAVRAGLGVLQAFPLFVVALLLLLAFANPETLAWFPANGLARPSDIFGEGIGFGQTLAHLVLPVAALTLAALPELTLQLEAALAQELDAEYATTARAKGLAERAVIRRHALRNALLPTLTQLTDLLPALVAGAVVVEVVFGLPGMGRLLAEAGAARDYPVLVGGVLLTGAARLFSLLLADVFYFWADPRIRWQ